MNSKLRYFSLNLSLFVRHMAGFLANFVYTEIKFEYNKSCFHSSFMSLLIKALAAD